MRQPISTTISESQNVVTNSCHASTPSK